MTNKNILPKVINKETEIKALWELFQADTYFTDYFSHDDVQQMENNIRHDIPLLNATSISEKFDNLKEVNTQMAHELDRTSAVMTSRVITIKDLEIKELEQKEIIKELIVTMLKEKHDSQIVYDTMSIDDIVKLKIEKDITLCECDREFVLNKIDSNRFV